MTDRLFGLVEREVSRRGGGEAELWVRRSRVRRYEARDGGIDAISFSASTSLGIRVFRDGRMGFSYGFGESEDDLRKAVESAVFCADASDRDEAHGLPGREEDDRGGADGPAIYDPSCETVDDREKADFTCELESLALSGDPRVKRVRAASLAEGVEEVALRNSRGRERKQRESSYFAFVEAMAEEAGQGQTGYGFGFARRLRDLSCVTIAGESVRRAVGMLGARPLPTGRYAAVIENGAAADLLDVIAPSFLAPQVVKGKSMLAGKIGRAVGAPLIGIVDDPLDPDGSGATAFDGEGVSSRQSVLVREGVLGSYLTDTFWGRKIGAPTSASLRRPSPKSPPAVGTGGLRLAAGGVGMAGMLRDLGGGVILKEFLGIHTADPVSGDFSVGASGVRFEGGEEKEAVRGFAVSGNVLSLLGDVVAVGDDFRWYGTTGCPSVAVSRVEIGGA